MRRRAEITLAMFIGIVIVLLVLWLVVFPLLKRIWTGSQSTYACDSPRECMVSCPSGYVEHGAGSIDCKDDPDAGGGVCCEPLETGGAAFVRSGDIQLYWQSKDDPIANGETVALVPTGDGGATGKLILNFAGSAKGQFCYWLAGEEATRVFASQAKTLLGDAFNKRSSSTDPVPCESQIGTSPLTITKEQYPSLLGEKRKLSLVVVDKSCEQAKSADTVDLCSSSAHTFYVQVPDRSPKIAVALDGKIVVPGTAALVTPGKSYDVEVKIDEPLAECSVTQTFLMPQTPERFVTLSDLPVKQASCLAKRQFVGRYTLAVPADAARGIPFAINVSTALGSKRTVSGTYAFLVEPDARLRAVGPPPGIAKEKNVDIACAGECQKLEIAFVDSAFKCARGASLDADEQFSAAAGLLAQGAGKWRLSVANETRNDRYVCVKATTATGDAYALGLWNNVPIKLAIDRTPPALTVSYDGMNGTIWMTCQDQASPSGAPPSGCKARPYSYAYIVDPLKFVTNVVAGGALSADYRGCPDVESGTWIPFNSDQQWMVYNGREVRVICVRATDAAGNGAFATKLLYSTQEVLNALLCEVTKQCG